MGERIPQVPVIVVREKENSFMLILSELRILRPRQDTSLTSACWLMGTWMWSLFPLTEKTQSKSEETATVKNPFLMTRTVEQSPAPWMAGHGCQHLGRVGGPTVIARKFFHWVGDQAASLWSPFQVKDYESLIPPLHIKYFKALCLLSANLANKSKQWCKWLRNSPWSDFQCHAVFLCRILALTFPPAFKYSLSYSQP